MPSPPLVQNLHFDHAGSYLRPKHLIQARKDKKQSKITAAELRKLEDAVIDEVVAKQLKAGMKVVTDGEARREYFHLDFLEQLGGIQVTHNTLDSDNETYVPPTLAIVGKVEHKKPIQLADFKYLRSKLVGTGAIPKVCIPSPTMAHFRGGRAAISSGVYPDLEDFFKDLVIAYRAEIKSLYDAGCRFIQLDDTNLAYLCDVKMRSSITDRGEDVDALPDRYAALINACISERPADLIIGMHLCRGNFRSQFFASGGYEPVAKIIFNDIAVDVLYLEWESDRAGDFQPLRFLVPNPNRKVILGLVSSKFADMEDKNVIIGRIKEAAGIIGNKRQLGLSTQCGFSSTYHGNAITEEDQWLKLGLIREIAEEVWGASKGFETARL